MGLPTSPSEVGAETADVTWKAVRKKERLRSGPALFVRWEQTRDHAQAGRDLLTLMRSFNCESHFND